MELTPQGFELTSLSEWRTARDALNYEFDRVRSAGDRIPSDMISVYFLLGISLTVECEVPAGDYKPYLGHLKNALTSYAEAEIPATTLVQRIIMNKPQREEAQRRGEQQVVARAMLSQIDEAHGGNEVLVNDFASWVSDARPEDIIPQGNDQS